MISLPPGWKEVFDGETEGYLALADGPSKKIHYKKWWHWTNWPVIKFFICYHERIHAKQYEKYGKMWHVDSPSIVCKRGTLEWWLTPIYALFRWDWLDKDTRRLVDAE
jgi:hypothetical protein